MFQDALPAVVSFFGKSPTRVSLCNTVVSYQAKEALSYAGGVDILRLHMTGHTLIHLFRCSVCLLLGAC